MTFLAQADALIIDLRRCCHETFPYELFEFATRCRTCSPLFSTVKARNGSGRQREPLVLTSPNERVA
jgi:hypothetical protein